MRATSGARYPSPSPNPNPNPNVNPNLSPNPNPNPNPNFNPDPRCVKPNAKKVQAQFDGRYIAQQLQVRVRVRV